MTVGEEAHNQRARQKKDDERTLNGKLPERYLNVSLMFLFYILFYLKVETCRNSVVMETCEDVST